MRILLAFFVALIIILPHIVPSAAFSLPVSRRQFGAAVLVQPPAAASSATNIGDNNVNTIIYHPLSITVDGTQVPVAAWYPFRKLQNTDTLSSYSTYYEHRISVSKIGKSLAGWNLPSFVDRNFSLQPSLGGTILSSSSRNMQLPTSVPVVLLAHGYLGSRFDLSHLGEALASAGFLVLSPEYPESLAASYDATNSITGVPIDRAIITNQLLKTLTNEWNVQPTTYGIVGHSLGCGTVDRTGDSTWTRVCLAGYPSMRGPNSLFVGSINDGAVSVSRAMDALREYSFSTIDEEMARAKSWGKFPSRAYLLFNNPRNAPNHISFLSEETNEAMVEFLSPLLPLARFMSIPVLDFDKYQMSRDSVETGDVVIPLVVDYLKQMMT